MEEKDRTHRLLLQPLATGILGGIAAVLPLALECGGAAVVSSRLRNCRCQGPCAPLILSGPSSGKSSSWDSANLYPSLFPQLDKFQEAVAMGVQKKEKVRKEREGKTGDGMGNVKVKGTNFYRYVLAPSFLCASKLLLTTRSLTVSQRCEEGQGP